MSSETVVLKARMRSFRLWRSPMTCGRAAFWLAALSYAALFLGKLTLAWCYGVAAVLLGIAELVLMRKRAVARHPGLAIVGLLLGLAIVALPMLLRPAQQAMRQSFNRLRSYAAGTFFHSRPSADRQLRTAPKVKLLSRPKFDPAETFEVLPRWKKGEKRRFQMIKTRTEAHGKKIVRNTSRSDLEIEVLSADKRGFVVAWTVGQTKVDRPVQAESPLMHNLTSLAKGLRVVFELDSQGAIQGVQNWKELQAGFTKTNGLLAADMKYTGLDPTIVAAVRAQLESMLVTKLQIEQVAIREPQLFFMVHRMDFKRGMGFEDKLPSPFGGEPNPSLGRYVLEEIDENHGVARIAWHQSTSTGMAGVMEKLKDDIAHRVWKTVSSAELGKTSLTVEESAEFTLELSSGWVRSFRHKRLTTSDGAWQEDVTTITRKMS